MNTNFRKIALFQYSVLLLWIIITQHVFIDGSSRNLWLIMFVNDSKSSKSPSWETRTNSALSCATSCHVVHRGACRGFFFNKQDAICSMHGVDLQTLPLIPSPGSNGFVLGALGCSYVDREGVYSLYPPHVPHPISVYCDVTSQGERWLVFQRRMDGSEDFFRTWDEYKDGFGDLTNEFWLGNTFIHQLTKGGNYELRIDLKDFENETRYATYTHFSIASQEDLFKLHISGYHGNAGDCMDIHNGRNFSAMDRDLDPRPYSCAVRYSAGWWYSAPCHRANLNGLYFNSSIANGVNWKSWRGFNYSLKATVMKIRPRL